MRTRCPGCQTTFRVTPDQLKARAGKVRCGQCQSVFNALDSLLDENTSISTTAPLPVRPEVSVVPANEHEPAVQLGNNFEIDILLDSSEEEVDSQIAPDDTAAEAPAEDTQALSEAAAQALGKATGLILPRETSDIPGYSKWAEGVMASPFTQPEEKSTRWPFILSILLLLIVLAGQLTFRFRSEIAVSIPALRPIVEVFCQAFDADIPLPRNVELVSIETSDLQTDTARGNLLVLNATLRNRASYGQAYPSLELSLTDTTDAAIARRVFPPAEYLSPKNPANHPFAPNSDVPVRLWIEAKGISAAGYRLYVFYP